MILEKKETQLEALRNALIAGEQSGRTDYFLNDLIDELNAELPIRPLRAVRSVGRLFIISFGER